MLGEPFPQFAGIIGTIRNQPLGCWGSAQQFGRADEIVGVAGRNDEGERTPVRIGQRVDFARASASRSADSMTEGPPFAPAAER